MIRLRTALLGVLLWCGVVTVVASLVWVVISRAGQGIVPSTRAQADVTASLPVPHHRLRTSPGVTLAPRPSPPSTAPATGTTTSPGSPAPPTSTGTPTLPPPAAPRAQRRSWSGNPGHVVAECTGASVRLVAAFPNADWSYVIGSRGPAMVSVRFTHRVGDDWQATVEARCVSGVPHFTLPGHQGGDD